MPNLLDVVNLYYLGGLKESEHPFVSSKGRAFALPPVGGYLKLPYFNATDLMRRNVVVTRNGSFPVFSLDPRAAERALRGPAVVEVPKEYTREELLEMLAAMSDVSDPTVEIEDLAEPNVATPISEEEAAKLPEAELEIQATPVENKPSKSNKNSKPEKQEAK